MNFCRPISSLFKSSSFGLPIKKTIASLGILLTLVLSGNVAANAEPEEIRQLLQLAEYVGVDYVSAVKDGKVIDRGEYQEMLEFSGIILEKSAALTTEDARIQTIAQSLQLAIINKRTVAVIQNLATQLRQILLALSPQLSFPRSLTASSDIKMIFQNDCSSCHGELGKHR